MKYFVSYSYDDDMGTVSSGGLGFENLTEAAKWAGEIISNSKGHATIRISALNRLEQFPCLSYKPSSISQIEGSRKLKRRQRFSPCIAGGMLSCTRLNA